MFSLVIGYYTHLQFSMVGKLKNKSERFFGIVHVCACKCGTRVAGLSRKVIQSLQIVCTRLGSTLCVCFSPNMSL